MKDSEHVFEVDDKVFVGTHTPSTNRLELYIITRITSTQLVATSHKEPKTELKFNKKTLDMVGRYNAGTSVQLVPYNNENVKKYNEQNRKIVVKNIIYKLYQKDNGISTELVDKLYEFFQEHKSLIN